MGPHGIKPNRTLSKYRIRILEGTYDVGYACEDVKASLIHVGGVMAK